MDKQARERYEAFKVAHQKRFVAIRDAIFGGPVFVVEVGDEFQVRLACAWRRVDGVPHTPITIGSFTNRLYADNFADSVRYRLANVITLGMRRLLAIQDAYTSERPVVKAVPEGDAVDG